MNMKINSNKNADYMCNLKFIKPTLKSLQEESWEPHENPDFFTLQEN